MTPKKQITARDIVSPKPSKEVRDLFKRVLIAAKKDQDELLAKARSSEKN